MFEEEVVGLLESSGVKTSADKLETPPQEEFGDLSFPCFELAKEQRKNPTEIANEIASKIQIPSGSAIEKVDVRGSYVNFFFDYTKLSNKILKNTKTMTKLNFGKNKKIVIEYSSPNPIHPIHVGTSRNTFIGEPLSRIFEFAGYRVKRICYINDLGKQVAILTHHFLKNKIKLRPNKKPDRWLLDFYIKSNDALKKDPEIEKDIEKILYEYENGNKKISSVVKKLVETCIRGFEATWKLTGTKFDEYLWENKFVNESRKYVKQLIENKSAFVTSEGATIINLEPYGLTNTVILRSDNTGLYITRDIASNIYKVEKNNPFLNIVVTGEDQKLHFKQVFKIIELLGHKDVSEKCRHIPYAYVALPEGKLSSRLGRVVLIDDVFEKAKKEVKKRFKVKDGKLTEKIGISAVVYAIMKIDADKQVIFTWDDVLNLQGNSGPYLQYAYTRCSSILKKAKKWKNTFSIESINDDERKLIKRLSEFPNVIERITIDLKPTYICKYTYDLATTFNNFYEKHRVINAETKELKNFRLNLVKATQNVLGKCLELMGMHTVERM